jgi:hypothetical protein
MRPEQKEASMLSALSRIQIVAATIVAAAIGAAAGLAGSEGDSQPLAGVTVDQSTAARHRALGLLGEPRVILDRRAIARHRALGRLGEAPHGFSDSAVTARHRALGRLPAVRAHGTAQTEADPSSWFPWKKTVLGFAVLAACLLIGFGLTRAGRVRTRRAA